MHTGEYIYRFLKEVETVLILLLKYKYNIGSNHTYFKSQNELIYKISYSTMRKHIIFRSQITQRNHNAFLA